MEKIAIIGCSNVGKTTFFNQWLNASMPTGNRAGVTVDVAAKRKKVQQSFVTIIDTPGVRALTPSFYQQLPKDAQVTHDVVYQQGISRIINVVDGRQLERDVFLSTQLMELGLPMIMVINQFPLGERPCDVMANISEQLGLMVISGQQDDLNKVLTNWLASPQKPPQICLPLEEWLIADHCHSTQLTQVPNQQWLRWMQKDPFQEPPRYVTDQLSIWSAQVGDLDVWLTEKRMQYVADKVGVSLPERTDSVQWDRWLTHHIIGLLIFVGVMIGLFYITVFIGGALQEYVYAFLKIMVINGVSSWCAQWMPVFVLEWVFHGALSGVIMMVSFLPLMWLLNFMQHLLEETGYWPRAVFLVDRWMSRVGLHGQSFIPLMLGFGCNVPAVAATRTMTYQKDRILTAMMVPFMSCSARLTLYVVFAVVFFQDKAFFVIAFLYLLGVTIAVLTGLVLNRCVFQQERSPLLQVLPPMQWPSMGIAMRAAWLKSSRFVYRACQTVVPVCVGLVVLTQVQWGDQSVLQILGQWLSTLFIPLGLGPEAWPIGVALIVGILAKEAIIGVLATLLMGQAMFTFNWQDSLWMQWQNMGQETLLGDSIAAFFPLTPMRV